MTRLSLPTLGEVSVLGAPANELLESEWEMVQRARESYVHMWGAGSGGYTVAQDPCDGRGEDALDYRATHYLTTVRTPGKPDKIVTMRRVAPRPRPGQPAPPLVQDLDLWQVARADGTVVPLAGQLRAFLEGLPGADVMPGPACLPVASLSRSGTYPYERNPERGIDDRNRTAVGFALMQWAALRRDPTSLRYVGSLCEEFRTKAFALHLPDGDRVELAWRDSAEAMGLDRTQAVVRLDRSKPVVRDLLLSFPGYWLDNEALGNALVDLLHRRVLDAAALAPACRDALASADAASLGASGRRTLQALDPWVARLPAFGLSDPDPQQLAAAARCLARPRLAKHLGGLLRRPDVAEHVLAGVGDGPYSGCLEPTEYRNSVVRLLREARRLYDPAYLDENSR